MSKKGKKTEAKRATMTVEQFKDRYDGVGYDVEELASAASIVDGDVGDAACDVLEAIQRFNNALTDIDFEVG